MTSFDLGEIATPISDEAPCGADLEFDRDYANFMAAVTNRLPKTFFVVNRETGATERFDPGSHDFSADLDKINTFLAATKDIRLLALACRIAALKGDLDLFASAIGAIRTLLELYWDDAYPVADEGDFTERNNTIVSLDDRGQVILPLTSARLVDAPRFGAISFRHMQIALGQAEPIASETAVDAGSLTQAVRNAKGEAVAAAHASLVAARAAVGAINQMLIEHIGVDRARTLRQLPAILEEMIRFLAANAPAGSLDAAAAEAAASAPEAGSSAEAPPPDAAAASRAPPPPTASAGGAVEDESGRIASSADARAALEALREYFSRKEPSSPALILVQHAIGFVDKSFAEILDALAPQRKLEASFKLGTGEFVLPLDVAMAATADGGDQPAAAPATFTIENRQQADRLIRLVRSFYEANEPSSPIPLILARASECLSRDFLALMNDLIPPPPPTE